MINRQVKIKILPEKGKSKATEGKNHDKSLIKASMFFKNPVPSKK